MKRTSRTACAAAVLAALSLMTRSAWAQTEPASGGTPPSHSASGGIGVPENTEPVLALSLKTQPEALKTVTPTKYRYEYGAIDPLKTPRLELPLVIRNISKEPVYVSRITTTCGCTSVIPREDRQGSKEKPLQPGAEMEVQLVVDFTQVPPGLSSKSAFICVGEERKIVAALEMTGTTRELVSFSPRMIDFGRIPAGTGQSLTLTVTMDERMREAAERMPLTSFSPDVTLTPEGKDRTVTQGDQRMRVRVYRVSVSKKASLGRLTTGVTFARPGQMPGMGTTPTERLLTGARAAFMGEVSGTIAAAPEMVMFSPNGSGAIAEAGEGSPPVQRVMLSGDSPDALKDLKLTPNATWFTARLIPDKTGSTATIEIRLAPKQAAPSGASPEVGATLPRQGYLEVHTRAGELLRIPVMAFFGDRRAASGISASAPRPAP